MKAYKSVITYKYEHFLTDLTLTQIEKYDKPIYLETFACESTHLYIKYNYGVSDL